MKVIKYKLEQVDTLVDVLMEFNETNLEIAKKEAFNGDYTIENHNEID